MTDSILRSYYNVTNKTFVPFPADTSLLTGETDGLAIDFMDQTYFNLDTSLQLWNQVRTAGVDSLTSPHTFYTNSGTSPKVINTSATGLGWSPHNMFLNSGAPATQNVALVIGFSYTYGITGSGTLTGSAGASGAATAGSPVTFTATTSTGTFTVSGGPPTTMQINRGIVLTTYLVTTGSIVNALPISYNRGLLVEPAVTNLCLRSEDISTTWTNGSSTETVNAVAAPDGATTADKIVEASDVAQIHYITQGITVSAGTSYTYSVYAKAAERSAISLEFDSNAGGNGFRILFNLNDGTITTAGTTYGAGAVFSNGSITLVGNGWYRCTATGTVPGTDGRVYLVNCSGSNRSYNGDGTSGLYVWGVQLEASAVATSYVPTAGASATRATDAVNVATSSYPHSATNGTFVVWVTPRFTNNPSFARLFTLSNGTTAENIQVAFEQPDTPDSIYLNIVDGGVSQVADNVTKSGTASLSGNKAAAFYKLNDSGIVVDAGSEVVDTACTMPTVTNLQLGYDTAAASRELNGFIRRLIYVPRRMTTAEMQTKTT